MNLYSIIILSLCLLVPSKTEAVTERNSHSAIEKVDFNKLSVDVQQYVVQYLPD